MSDNVPNPNEWLQYQHLHPATPMSNTFNPTSGCPPTPSPPTRKRSRASKKTPTTLLSANAHNFRALVQHFTGCPTSKGPVHLNFNQNRGHDQTPAAPDVPYGLNSFGGQQSGQQEMWEGLQKAHSFPGYPSNESGSGLGFPNNGFVLENVSFNELVEGSSMSENRNDGYFM